MSEPRPGDEPGVYTLPEGSFRVGAVPEGPSAPPSGPATDPGPAPDAGVAESDAPRRRRVWDVVLTLVLLLVATGTALLGSFLALYIVFLADGCGTVNCDYGRLNLGLWVALSGPWAAWVIAVVVSIVLLVRRRLAFWMPLAGMALIVGVWVLGAWVAASGVG